MIFTFKKTDTLFLSRVFVVVAVVVSGLAIKQPRFLVVCINPSLFPEGL